MKKYCMIVILFDLLVAGLLGYRYMTTSAGGIGSDEEEVYISDLEEKPKVAITFDDGPNEVWTPVLLDGLKERGVKASFFVIGEKAKEQPELISRMYKEGHVVGNHTYTHVQLTALGAKEACQQVKRTNVLLERITGEYPTFIRPPFGSWNEKIGCNISMIPVMWTIDTLDWKIQNTAHIVQTAVAQVKDGSIILLHDNYETSVQGALEIIDRLEAEGYEFVTVEELLLN